MPIVPSSRSRCRMRIALAVTPRLVSRLLQTWGFACASLLDRFCLAACLALGDAVAPPPPPTPPRRAARPRAAPVAQLAAQPGRHPLSRPSPSTTACGSSSTRITRRRWSRFSIWYNVGSKDEPAGRTGFAHLFEHLMFNGSENAPRRLFRAAARDRRDRLQRHHLVRPHQLFPDRADARRWSARLFLESDRMGHLLGAVTQEKLDQPDRRRPEREAPGRQPAFGLVEYAQLEGLFPEGHPYHHSTIGSMADLDAATLETCASGSATITGPNNAVLVLAGDIDARRGAAAGREIFRRHSARHRSTSPPQADVPTLAGARRPGDARPGRQHPPLPRLGGAGPDSMRMQVPLEVAASVLGGLASSRLDNALVRGEQTAVSRLGQRPAVPPGQPVRGHGRREAGRGCRRRVAAARRDHRRFMSPTARPRTRSAAR